MHENKNLVKIDQSTKFENIFAICSFNSKQIKQPQIKYSGDCSIINSKNNIFVYLSANGEMQIKKENQIHTDNFFKKLIKKKKQYSSFLYRSKWMVSNFRCILHEIKRVSNIRCKKKKTMKKQKKMFIW